MIPVVKTKIRERGPTPRAMRGRMNAWLKDSWSEGAWHFHINFTPNRFTHEHARAAQYAKRNATYTARKKRTKGHTLPLVWEGHARRNILAMPNVTSTSRGARIRYRGARVFNYRKPHSDVDMVKEFTRILPREADAVALRIDEQLDTLIHHYNGTG